MAYSSKPIASFGYAIWPAFFLFFAAISAAFSETTPEKKLPAEVPLTPQGEDKTPSSPDKKAEKETSDYRYFAALCMANAYPELRSEKLIDRFLNTPMHILSPGFEEINTFGDMRDDHLLWVPNPGVGMILSDHFSIFVTLGYGAGPVRTKETQPSWLLFPIRTDFEMKRSAFTITPGIDYFPFGMVEQRDYHGIMDRLRGIRPMIGARIPWTYAGYKAHAKIALRPFGNLVDLKLSDNWSVWSMNLNVGADIPISRRNQVNVNFGKSIFFSHDYDFGGPVFSITWKYLF